MNVMPVPSYTIRHLDVSPGLVLAPMSGVTNSPFRRLIKQLNPGAVGMVISEFISVEGMTRQSRRSLEMMHFRECERPFGIQIFGYDADRMRDAAVMVEQSGADLLDINCGCPAPKVVKRGGGCELMRQPEQVTKILKAVRAAVKIPLTLKMRSGWDEKNLNALEIARIAEGEGVEAVAIHGRTRAQLYRGQADWDVIRQVSSEVNIPVLGSGDVVDRESALKRLAYGAKGLFIGRAAIFNPYVFTEIMLDKSIALTEIQTVEVIEQYISLLLEDLPPRSCVGKVKQLVSQFVRGYPWRKDICRADSLEAQIEILKRVKDPQHKAPLIAVGDYREQTLPQV